MHVSRVSISSGHAMMKRSKNIRIAVAAAALTATVCTLVWQTYAHTKASYRVVGFSDGLLEAREQFLLKLRALGPLERCPSAVIGEKSTVEFLTVKDQTLFAYRSLSGTDVRFCYG
jgi:hypothetical protein